PVAVSKLAIQIGLDDSAVIASLLHDTLEDTKVTSQDISQLFGDEVLKLVQGVTNLRGLGKISQNEEFIANTRKMILASADDVRVLLIKLCDRMHNARTIKGLSPERRRSYADEILLIFAPLSEYFGIGVFQKEFQDIAFREIDPDNYSKISSSLREINKKQAVRYEKFAEEIQTKLKELKIKSEISFRKKGIYSSYKKLEKYEKDSPDKTFSLKDFPDLFALRILVKTVPECYTVLGYLHQRWNYIPEEFSDYISKPKPNGYRSIHTILETNRWGKVEVQIKTFEMHEYNEFGPASHIAYKAGGKTSGESFSWVKNLMRWTGNKNNGRNDYEVNLFNENVYLFTPKGQLIELPKDATPIDFAYRIHSSIGDSCTGAKVNGKIVSLDTKLKTGDQVEIIVSKSKKYPSRDWLNIAVSQSTKAHIRRGLREKESFEARQEGKTKVFEAIKSNQNYSENEIESLLLAHLNEFNCNSLDTLYERVGHKTVTTVKVVNTLYPDKNQHQRTKKNVTTQGKMVINIEGIKELEYQLAKCCNPKPKDKICAYLTTQNTTKIHKAECLTLRRMKGNSSRLLKANWEEKEGYEKQN
ncbi:bifunctional (p)ppGpp synthetase/guanosine-3',5'-bis(diphosphate) 3'-pyrophosphohydrolase, partial [Candidatus Dojkabacteria bacterium]|nr:bifunctional (p)ppGpp synthetase/guanosine-3',5'-bis(diphosphate) 3'-pyrophosphohydrolase [Candidatus Dojkabacteria bacterium]